MNLLFFTVELERNGNVDRPRSRRLTAQSRPRPSRFRWIGLAMAVLVCVAAAGCGGWFLAGGDPLVAVVPDWLALDDSSALAGAGDRAWLGITSQPGGAAVFIDGHQKGKTPLFLAVSRTTHTLMLKHPEAVDDRRQVTVSTDMDVSVSMWRRRPDAVQLRPAYPGANISDAVFLADGRLALSMALPVQASGPGAGALRQAWIFDPAGGSLEPFNATGAIPRAAVVAVSPDGRRVAYLQPGQSETQRGGADPRLSEVWVGGAGTDEAAVQVLALPARKNPAERGSPIVEVEGVHDVAWTPDSRHLLVTAQLVSVSGGYPAGPRSRLLLVDAPAGEQEPQPPPIELAILPARMVRGSYTWAPDGHWVAFLTQANGGPGSADFVALCAVDTSAGGAVSGFRYVADLARQSTQRVCCRLRRSRGRRFQTDDWCTRPQPQRSASPILLACPRHRVATQACSWRRRLDRPSAPRRDGGSESLAGCSHRPGERRPIGTAQVCWPSRGQSRGPSRWSSAVSTRSMARPRTLGSSCR